MNTWIHGHMESLTCTWRHGHVIKILGNSDVLWKRSNGKDLMEKVQWKPPAIFLNPFVDEETNGNNPFANGLNGLN